MKALTSLIDSSTENPQHGENWLERILANDAIVQVESADQDISWQKPSQLVDRRQSHRHQYCHPLVITPIDDFLNGNLERSCLVQGSNISATGVAFQHLQPIADQNVSITFSHLLEEAYTVEVNLKWCRFSRSGIYQSGGSIVAPIAHSISPSQVDWLAFPHG